MSKKTVTSKQTGTVARKGRVEAGRASLQPPARPRGGAQKDPYKEAWMKGARSGTEVAFDLIMRSLENMGRTLGIKRRKRPSV